MKTIKERFTFLSKHFFAIKIIIVLFLSCCAISTAYLYGSTSNSVQIQSNLMQVDYDINPSKTSKLNFLHGEVLFDDVLTEKQKYDKSLEIMRRALGRNRYFNMYMVSSYKGQIRKYQSSPDFPGFIWENFSITMVRNFWDNYLMENISVPLFRSLGKNGIKPKKNAMFGAYISSTTAYKFVLCNGMLEKNNNDIKAAFNELLDDEDYFFEVSSNETPLEPLKKSWKFSINNIYLTNEHFYLLEENADDSAKDAIKNIHKRYRDYYKTYSYWNDESMITYCQDMFTQGFNLTFDIAGSYFNYEYFLKNIIGSDYSENGMMLKFIGKDKDLTKYSDEINKYAVSKDPINYIYLMISIISFVVMLLCFGFMFDNIRKIKNKFLRFLLYSLPLFPFVFSQLFVHLFILFTHNLKSMYLIFNYIGNTIIVLYALVGLIYSLLWSSIDGGKTNISN